MGKCFDAPQLVTVAIVNFNAGPFLARCVDSLRHETSIARIIVVDNCSTDGSLDLSPDTRQEIEIVRLEVNVGYSAAVNVAMGRVSTPFVLIMNPDVEFTQPTLSQLLSRFDDPTIGIVTPRLILPDGSTDWACHRRFPMPRDMLFRSFWIDRFWSSSSFTARYRMGDVSALEEGTVECPSGAFMLTRTHAARAVGPWDERFFLYGEDLDWAHRFALRGWRCAYVPSVLVRHHKSASTRRHAFSARIHYYRSLSLLLAKWYGLDLGPIRETLIDAMLILACLGSIVRRAIVSAVDAQQDP